MIDTVILTIPRDKMRFINNEGGMSAWDLQSRTPNYEKFVQNPPRPLSKSVYRPRLTGIKRRTIGNNFNSFLKIEFSVPKLIYGNNFDEITDQDFDKIAEALYQRLIEMGVIISRPDLENASVSAFHPSKNIMLSDGYTASSVSKELAKINLNKKFDLSKTSFRNDGQSLQGYTVSHSIVFYDKIADMAQSEKRAIDKDQTTQQLQLFQIIKNQRPSLEVLRMEVRLSQKQKMNGVLRKLGFPDNPTFKDVCKKDICQKIVRFYWDTLIKDENLFLFELLTGPKQLLKDIFRKHPRIKPKEAVYLTGLSLLCKDDDGIRGLRQILSNRLTQRNWYRISDGIKMLNSGVNKKSVHSWVKQIEDSIDNFSPIRAGSEPP